MNALDAFHTTVHSYPGGCEALSARMGVGHAVLRNKANPNFEHNKPTLADADLVMTLSRNYSVLHALAQNHGHVCVEMPAPGAVLTEETIIKTFSQVWAANGQVGAEVDATMEDGIVEPHEVAKVRAAVYTTVQALMSLVVRLEAMAVKK